MVLPTPHATPAPMLREGTIMAEASQRYRDTEDTTPNPDQLERPPGIGNDKPSPPFRHLVGLFHKLRDAKPAERKNILAHWFAIWRQQVGNDLYPAMRLILPQKDRERATYGLKEANLARTYIAALGLEKTSPDAIRLVKWKMPTKDNPTAGDFPTIVYEVIKARSSVETGTISVDELNDVLDHIAKSGKEEGYTKTFSRLVDICTPDEHRWIVRIILKDLNISVRENTVLTVFHPDAMEMFNTSSDLKRVCWILPSQEHQAPKAEMQIQLFKAFQPMLCKRGNSLPEAVKLMGKKEFYMEEKLDGERMQLHKRGHQFYYSSRKGKDYTYLYGAHVGVGALTPFIQGAIKDIVVDLILDGEMLVWDPNLEKYCSFGNLKSAALDAMIGNAVSGEGPRPCFKVFDILYVGFDSGEERLLTEMPLRNRKKLISSLITEVPGRLECATHKMGKSIQDVEKLLQEIVEARGEGLVLKTSDSRYIPGGRENCWAKVKPEYMDQLSENVDVLVVAGNWGQGRRGGKVATLICAIKDDSSSTASTSQTRWSTFVRVGTGMSFADYEWINKKNWKPFDRRRPPAWLRLSTASGTTEDYGDVYIEPEESFVITVKAAAITATEQYGCSMTMRFPRCIHIRNDLQLDDVLSYSELVSLSQGKRKAEDPEGRYIAPKKRKANTGRRAVAQLSSFSRGQNLKGIPRKSDLFEGITFRIFPDAVSKPPLDKPSLERLVYEHGGDFTQALTENVDQVVLIYGGVTKVLAVSRIMDQDQLDILKPQWIVDCIAEGCLVAPTRKYYFHATTERQQEETFEDNDTASDDEGMKVDTEEPPAASLASEEEHTEDEESEWVQVKPPENVADRERLEAIRDDDGSDSATEDEYDILPTGGRGVATPSLDFSDSEIDDDAAEPNEKRESAAKQQVDEGLAQHMGEIDVNKIEKAVPDVESSTLKSSQSTAEMGDDEDAMEYDGDKIFKHLCFYLDFPSLARAIGMEVKVSQNVETIVTTGLKGTGELIEANGGRVTTDLDEAQLTHIVIHEKDKGRRVELIRRTALPKRRHIVLPAFIEDSLAEETLLNEEAYVP